MILTTLNEARVTERSKWESNGRDLGEIYGIVRELKQQRRRQQGKRHVKSEVALPQT